MDMKQIKSLLQEFDASTLSKLKITQDSFSIELEKNTGVVAAPVMAAAPAAVAAAPVAAVAPSAPAEAAAPAAARRASPAELGTTGIATASKIPTTLQ